MENQTPVINPVNQLNSNPVVESKQNSFLVILLSILLFLSVLIAGFFAYQTQILVAELRIKNDELSQAKVIPTTEPTQKPVATPDPTADLSREVPRNWKTYINTLGNYEINYPSAWKIDNYGLMDAKPADSITKYVRMFYQPDTSKNAIELNIENSSKINISQQIKFDETRKIGLMTSTCGTSDDNMNTFCWLKIPNQANFLIFTITNYKNIEDSDAIDLILSTFKFTN